MNLRIFRPGALTTIQDFGRRGLQRYGVVGGGAMDALSLRIANSLVGNAESDAALEITLLGPTLQFDGDALIAICGGDWSPHVEDWPIPLNRPVWLRAGTTLSLGSARGGCRAYLAIAGGIDVPPIMGSRSTYLRARIGGLEGRALQVGDTLRFNSPSPLGHRIAEKLMASGEKSAVVSVPWWSDVRSDGEEHTLHVLRGSEFELLTQASQERLFSSDFGVTTEADRMGYRLSGPALSLAISAELISSAVCPGTIQLPPSGQPILLMADCATSGGYPKVAHVASVDLPKAAQLRPGDFFRLREISLAEAHNLYLRQEADLRCLQTNLKLKFAT